MSLLFDTIAAHKAGRRAGLYSVCSANEYVLRAAMTIAQRFDTPLLIEATSNQVDQFGGYTGMTPRQFRAWVEHLAAERRFDLSRLILGGDHLGPNAWQHMPATEAMARARDLIAAYVEAGFEKIHLDCSMRCTDDPERLDDELVARRAAELCVIAEATVDRVGASRPICYVIGTEVPVPGGETSLADGLAVTLAEAAAATLASHESAFAAQGLQAAWQRTIALVVQPGVDFDHSAVHHYDDVVSRELSAFIESQPRLVYEAHSTDYQTEAALHKLVRDHFAILKVGPAATYALREAWFALSLIERELVAPEARAWLPQVLERRMQEEPRHWQKYYQGGARLQELLRKYSFSDRSRYYWPDEEVQLAQQKLIDNLRRHPIPWGLLSQFMPEQFTAVADGRLENDPVRLVEHKIGQVLARYANACCRNQYDKVALVSAFA